MENALIWNAYGGDGELEEKNIWYHIKKCRSDIDGTHDIESAVNQRLPKSAVGRELVNQDWDRGKNRIIELGEEEHGC